MTVDEDKKYYNTSFYMKIYSPEEEGLYNFYFHSCPNYKNDDVFVDFTVRNEDILFVLKIIMSNEDVINRCSSLKST